MVQAGTLQITAAYQVRSRCINAVATLRRVGVRADGTVATVETLAEHATRTQDPVQLQSQVRVALGRQIVQDIAGPANELPVITLEPDLEQLLHNTVAAGNGDATAWRCRRGLPTVFAVSFMTHLLSRGAPALRKGNHCVA